MQWEHIRRLPTKVRGQTKPRTSPPVFTTAVEEPPITKDNRRKTQVYNQSKHLFVDNIINLKNPREATEDLSQLIKNQVR